MKPWYQVVTPREDLRENRPLDASEFAVHLDHIREGRASADYLDPRRFFARTHFTTSLVELTSQVLRRLSGIQVETSAVFNMATQFGGGKTHALAALYHLAKHGDEAKLWRGVETILTTAGISTVPKAAVATFVGTEFDPLTGRGEDGEPLRRTPWGEIAWQLGGAKSFAVVEQHDRENVAPGGDVIRKMLPAGPSLILMDELLNFVSRGRERGVRAPLFDFMQNLSETARAQDSRMVICVSIPKSLVTEMTPEDQEDYTRFKNMLDRLGKAILMSADSEMAEIIRRRLFEWEGLPSDANATIQAYADWVADNKDALVGLSPETAAAQFRSCYPFHPSLLSVFERKWQSLPRFQRTRGVLRLLALWVSWAWREEQRKATRSPLIELGSAPLEDPQFRAALFEQLGTNDLEGPLTTDIAGRADSHAVRLDRQATDETRRLGLHQKAATIILFESNGGQLRAEAAIGEIKAAIGRPEANLAMIDPVLEGLVDSCYYLAADRNRYRVSLTPQLNKVIAERKAGVAEKAIDDRVRKEIQTCFQAGPKDLDFERRFFPAKTIDVSDRPVLTLVVLGPDQTADVPGVRALVESIVRECGNSGRTFKAALLFALADSPAAMNEQARELLAWEDIEDDHDTVARLDEGQRRQLKQKLERAKTDLRETVWRSYRCVLLLGRDNVVRESDLGSITSSSAESMVDLILRHFLQNDEITKAVGANQLVRYWPAALTEWSTKAIRDAFYASPLLPRLLKGDVLRRTISDGVSQKVFGYARRNGEGKLKLERFGESLAEMEVEISEDVFLLKAADAQKLLEPPRIARLAITPASIQVKPGDIVTFSLDAADQYGQPVPLADVEWTATGGSIDTTGRFVAGPDKGFFTVHAIAGTLEASTDVRVAADGPALSTDPVAPGVLRWSGTVPPQKWMNFYTKVVSRFASAPGLKLTVALEVPVPPDQAKSKSDETKTALKELGLSDEVS
jgi:predicted DCC family thiol-disulfide oxidoreductase YuxK